MTLVDNTDRPDMIEADLEKNRSGLASALDELTNRASVDYVAREALGLFKVNTAEATRSLDRAMRANPMAFALVGAGVVWMVLGGRDKTGEDPDPEWHSHLGSLRDKARDTLARLEDEARSGVDSLKSGLQDQMGQVRDFAAERAQVIEGFAADLKNAIASGLEEMTEGARDKVMQARQESYSALLRAERVVKGGGREAVALVEEHPIATGAIALAVGAVAGVAFLRSGQAEQRNDPGWWAKKVTPAKADPMRQSQMPHTMQNQTAQNQTMQTGPIMSSTGGVSTGGAAAVNSAVNAGREPMV